MRITGIEVNNRKKVFEVKLEDLNYTFPFAKMEPMPLKNNQLERFWIDDDFGGEAFSYDLHDGTSGTIHVDQVLEYHRDPNYMAELLLYKLTLMVQGEVAASQLSTREIIRRLGTSPTQYYRLLDQTNSTKSINKMLNLFQILGCEVDVMVRRKNNGLENILISSQ